MKITGSLIEAYLFCPRQAWLMSRQLSGDQYNDFLSIGRLISEETYKKAKKEIIIEGGKIDIINKGKDKLVLFEVKKTSKHLRPATFQLLYYIYKLSEKGLNVSGELRIPKEKKIVSVELNEENKIELEKIINTLGEILKLEKPPNVKSQSYCRKCSYIEFCWS